MASIVVTFFTTHAALRAEKAAKAANIPASLGPAPRHLSVDCTLALSVSTSHDQQIRAILESQGIQFSGIHDQDQDK